MSKIYYDLFSEQMSDPEAVKIYLEALSLLKAGYWPEWYVAVIMQSTYRPLIEPADILAFSQVHAWIATGKVWTCAILIHHEPQADSEVELNNIILQRLPEPFRGEFDPEKGRSANSDGYIEATQPFLADNGWSANSLEEKVLPETHFALEVGSTKSYTTYRHLVESGRVARWPYGSKRIYLLDMREYFAEMKKTMASQFRVPRGI